MEDPRLIVGLNVADISLAFSHGVPPAFIRIDSTDPFVYYSPAISRRNALVSSAIVSVARLWT